MLLLAYASLCCYPSCMQFPYYTFVDRSKMYSIGSLFYAIYFFVSFPMFMRIDEDPKGHRWTLGEVRRLAGWWGLETVYAVNAVMSTKPASSP